MKVYKFLTRGVITTLMSVLLFSCSDSENSTPGSTNTDTTRESYIKYSVAGNVVNGVFSIKDSTDNDNTSVLNFVFNEETDEGTKKVVSIKYTKAETADELTEVDLILPAHTGVVALGEIETGSTGIINEYPTFYMTFSFKPEDAFFDNDDNGSNDLLTPLLSKTVSATITEYTETHNDLGILTLVHIKGSFEGTAIFKFFTSPTTDPGESAHTVTGEFEYNIPV